MTTNRMGKQYKKKRPNKKQEANIMFSKKTLSLLLAIVLIFSFAGTAFAYDQQKIDGSNWMSAVDGSKKNHTNKYARHS